MTTRPDAPSEGARHTPAIDALIDRLEAATHGSYALEVEIARAFGLPDHPPRNFTVNIDAALMLVPDGWHAVINWRDRLDGASNVALHEFPLPCRRVPEKEPFVIAARTAALAICLGALKARAILATVPLTMLPPVEPAPRWDEAF